jgi:hypothetical protein
MVLCTAWTTDRIAAQRATGADARFARAAQRPIRWADWLFGLSVMQMAPRVFRWVAMTLLVLLVLRGAFALALDVLRWGVANVELRFVVRGVEWTAFERCIDYTVIADRDTALYLARSIDDEGSWYRLAPTDTHLMGPMVWVTPTHLRIPTTYRAGCLRSLDNIVIEWASQ